MFIAVAEAKGFSAAAAKLGVAPSTVSQAVRQLETRPGAPLFHRTTRSVALSDSGAEFLARIGLALQFLDEATETLSDANSRPTGVLRLNVPRVAYLFVWQPVLKQYIETYPDVQTEVVIDSAMVYIVAHGFDAGMRFGGSVQPGMVAVSTGPILDTVVVASPEYLAAHGTPTHPNELSQHHCIGYRFLTSGQMEQWEFEKGDEHLRISTSPRLVLNDVVSIAHAALRGFGIAHLVSRYANDWLESGKLVRIPEDWSPQLPRMTLYYRDRRRVPLRLRLLIDLLAKEFSQPRAQ